jgi:hypothetical protein
MNEIKDSWISSSEIERGEVFFLRPPCYSNPPPLSREKFPEINWGLGVNRGEIEKMKK